MHQNYKYVQYLNVIKIAFSFFEGERLKKRLVDSVSLYIMFINIPSVIHPTVVFLKSHISYQYQDLNTQLSDLKSINIYNTLNNMKLQFTYYKFKNTTYTHVPKVRQLFVMTLSINLASRKIKK